MSGFFPGCQKTLRNYNLFFTNRNRQILASDYKQKTCKIPKNLEKNFKKLGITQVIINERLPGF